MKIPSLVRVPKYRRFNFEPRHYDPIKEDLKNRTELIEQQLKNQSSDSATKHRISEAFIRDKYRTGGKVNILQLALVFILSATFVGFLYIGFYAFFITGVIILLYVLFQLGTFKGITEMLNRKEEPEEETTAAKKIAAGQMREGQYFYRERTISKKGNYKLLLLVAATAVAAGYYLFALNGIMCLLLIFVLLIMFVKESSKG
ncbi:hypothetical protein GXP67_14770 [Rhodocytophaga rosea]|uniref:Uncharacterized protein n=1 Tax=Rhodocytophaga rosea TaxID=2704465 RepID=A0A6C0GIM7_9BACT|nr:hypothetical protein [Rhodocytophaga rosea]QHT67809.1 hypothetical protein GXP67_14770 [Rhodocytophaga rosea]